MIFGWDISTSVVGMSVFTASGSYVKSSYCDLRKLDVDMIDKGHCVERWINPIVKSSEPSDDGSYDHIHYIEDRLGGFASGRTMQQTLLKLAGFNAMVSYIIWREFHDAGHGGYVEYIHPSTAKSLMRREGLVVPKGGDKKLLTLEYVTKREPGFPMELNRNGKPQPFCFDMADSYCVARAGMLRKKNDAA